MGYQMTFKRYELKFMLTYDEKQALLRVMILKARQCSH